jgi:hypothetical protein
MKVLLRNFETGAFLETQTRWTKNHKKARDFVDHEPALRMAQKLRLQSADILYVTEGGTIFTETRVKLGPQAKTSP